jgi:hypothetical protein
VSAGTESGYWGELLTLPVDAPGDIRIDAQIRQKWNAGGMARLGVGVNNAPLAGGAIRNGAQLTTIGGPTYKEGLVALANRTFPGFPAMTGQNTGLADLISNIVVMRKNNYIFIYLDGLYVGQAAFAASITTVDIISSWNTGVFNVEKWIDYISVWPRECVK